MGHAGHIDRLILTAEAEMEGYSPVKVTQRLIDKVEVPK